MALYAGSSRRGQPKPTRGGSSGAQGGQRTTTGGKPLGVPKDYTATVQRSWTPSPGRSGRVDLSAARYTVEQGPRYFDGDEWKPASKPPEGIVEMQQKLVIAGYLDADEGFALGRWDGPTRKAYQFLLEDANAAGLTADSMLYRAAQSPQIGGGGGGGRDGGGGGGGGGGGFTIDPETGEMIPIPEEQYVAPAFNVQVPNFEDLRRTFRDASIDKLGMGMSQKDIDEMATAYQWKVMQVQADAYRQEVARDEQEFNYTQGRGGAPTTKQVTQVEAPSAETFAENELRRRDPGGFQATQASDFSQVFFDALGGYT